MSQEKETTAPWLNYLALTTVIFAVCATLSTFKGAGYSSHSVISQAQSSDQWAFYQAKSIKSELHTVERTLLQSELAALPPGASAAQRDAYQSRIDTDSKKIARYEHEKDQIKQQAQALEAQRDDAQRHGRPFGLAVIFLQVAILICSIAGLFKQRTIWFVALPVGAIGMLYFVDGFLLFF